MSAAFVALVALTATPAADPTPRHRPDPLAVVRHGPAYRYPQAGWIVLHVEGKPYERGFQHGTLLAPEIAAHVRARAALDSPKSPEDGWKAVRRIVNAAFLRGFDPEYLEEMKGIADGASDRGVRFGGRPLDVVDIAAINVWAELETLDAGLEAAPTGLEGKKFPGGKPTPKTPSPMGHCSAFVATGSATADGKPVIGHITMDDVYASSFYNVWLDVKPIKGRRVVMQSFAGGIHSGTDFYINDAGLAVVETTIEQTRYAPGASLSGRIRKAVQYADSIDDVVATLRKENNGLYTNEWLLADTKTNEIAMFELGTRKDRLWRSSKGEWFGGTEGFYWGCNNTKDLAVRLEAVASVEGRPTDVVYKPTDRDRTWVRLYREHKGKIDGEFARKAFTTPPLCGHPSGDAKYTTTEMIGSLSAVGLFGPPLGKPWLPTDSQKSETPEVRAMVSNPWTLLTTEPPAKADAPEALDIAGVIDAPSEGMPADPDTEPAWHGTLLPKTDADVWLTAGFAHYERIVALEDALREQADDGKLTDADRDRLAVALFRHRSRYRAAALLSADTPLSRTKAADDSDLWYEVAANKGVLVLAALREAVGDTAFRSAMEKFGRENAGKEVTTAAFVDFVNGRLVKGPLKAWDGWLNEAGDPVLKGMSRGGDFSVHSFLANPDQTLIVYGTADDAATNKATAEKLAEAIRKQWPNVEVPYRADADVKDADLKGRHLLLVGRPATNRLTERLQATFPVKFGTASVVLPGRDEAYAHAGTAVVVAGSNPLDRRYSAVAVAGLSAIATFEAVGRWIDADSSRAEVLVLPRGAEAVERVVGPAK